MFLKFFVSLGLGLGTVLAQVPPEASFNNLLSPGYGIFINGKEQIMGPDEEWKRNFDGNQISFEHKSNLGTALVAHTGPGGSGLLSATYTDGNTRRIEKVGDEIDTMTNCFSKSSGNGEHCISVNLELCREMKLRVQDWDQAKQNMQECKVKMTPLSTESRQEMQALTKAQVKKMGQELSGLKLKNKLEGGLPETQSLDYAWTLYDMCQKFETLGHDLSPRSEGNKAPKVRVLSQ